MKRLWLAVDQHFVDDERVVHLADEHGPSAIATLIALMCVTRQSGSDGSVEIGYGSLARKAFLSNGEEAKRITEDAARLGLIELEETDMRVRIRFVSWSKWQAVTRRSGIGTEPKEPKNLKKHANEVVQVFDAWVAATDRNPNKTKLTNQRRTLIARRLKDYSVDDLIDAVKGIGQSAFHRGHNDRGKRYDSIELCLRDAAHIEQFRDDFRGQAAPAHTDNAFI